MQRLPLLLFLTFWLTFAAILAGRGVYFYVEQFFGFTAVAGLWLAVGYGVAYIPGALLTRRLVARFHEKRAMALLILGLALSLGVAAIGASRATFVVTGVIASGFFIGALWPIFESFVSAGRSASQTRLAIGRFNLAWSMCFPLPVAAIGLFLAYWPPGMFVVTAIISLLMLPLLSPLPLHPVHLAVDDPNRPPPDECERLRRQLVAARWLMLLSYALIFVLNALWPRILTERLQLAEQVATVIVALVDVARLAMFTLLYLWAGWHGRRRWLVASALIMPLGFFAVLAGEQMQSVGIVVVGTVVFGLMHGIAYFASLHYAMVVENASVEAGGMHEAVIGLSFALGPAVALLGYATGNMHYGLVPLIVLCIIAALVPLWRSLRCT